VKESCANANTNRYRAPLPRRSRSSFSNIEGRDFFPDGERWRHADPARGEKKTALPPGISRKRKARIDARPSQTTPTRPQIPQNCIDARKPRKLRSRAIGIFPRFTRAHIFFSTKSALINVGERAEKNFTPRKPRARVQTRRARSRENRAISVFDANRTGKKREERRESIRSSRRTIFVYLRFFFCFLFLACEKCEEGEFLRSEREREQREMKNRKIRCCDAKKKFEKLCLLSTFSRERERERERERLHIFKEETVLFCCRLMR